MCAMPTPALQPGAVYEVLESVEGLDPSGIRVVLEDGVVRLRGRVASTDDATVAALAIDHAFASAIEVIDELEVDPALAGAPPNRRTGSPDPRAAQRDQPWTPPDFPRAQR